MKLNKSKILRILEGKNNGISSYQLRKEAGVSKRRVDQVWSRYLQTDEIPLLKKPGRPAKPIEEADVHLVRDAYTKYGVSASTLEKLVWQDHGIKIPHNRIYRILLRDGLASSKGEIMPRKKKWIRYERRHSLTAVRMLIGINDQMMGRGYLPLKTTPAERCWQLLRATALPLN